MKMRWFEWVGLVVIFGGAIWGLVRVGILP